MNVLFKHIYQLFFGIALERVSTISSQSHNGHICSVIWIKYHPRPRLWHAKRIKVWNSFWEGVISGTLLSHSHKYTYFRKCCLNYDLIILYNIDASYLTMRPHPDRCRKGLRAMFFSYERGWVNSLEQVKKRTFSLFINKITTRAYHKIIISTFYPPTKK